MCGFTDGDGSFHGIIRKQKDYKNNFQVQTVFDLAEKNTIFINTDLKNMNNLFFKNKGIISTVKNMYHLKIVSIKTHENNIIPFFSKHKLQSRKYLDFLVYLQMCNLIKNNKHTTIQGINKFKTYVQLMRKLRVFVPLMIKKKFKKQLLI